MISITPKIHIFSEISKIDLGLRKEKEAVKTKLLQEAERETRRPHRVDTAEQRLRQWRLYRNGSEEKQRGPSLYGHAFGMERFI